jgi:hypothetical protein
MIAAFGEIILAVVAAVEPGIDVVRIVAVVAV